MKQIHTLIITGVFLLLIVVSCNKDEPDTEEITATSQYIEFHISYSGTAQTLSWVKHKLYFLVDYGNYTLYDNFSINANPSELEEGKVLISPYKFEPGFYEISGFWDWNDSESWEDYEPFIAPVNVDITGYEQPKVNIFVVDKSQPSDDGWIEGGIYYSGSSLGNHHIYLRYSAINISFHTIRVTNSPYDLSNGTISYSCWLPSDDIFALEFFWDINDNGNYDDGEPRDIETGIFISPGLPTVVNAELN